MKSWRLAIGVMLVGVGVAAALLWSRVDWRVEEPLRGDAPAVSEGPLTSPAGVRPTTTPDASTASREARPQSTIPVPAPSHLEPLFAALAVHRPAQPPEAPDYTLSDLDGRLVRLRDLRGKLVFLNIWATWCPPCRLEMPSMNACTRLLKRPRSPCWRWSIDRRVWIVRQEDSAFYALLAIYTHLGYTPNWFAIEDKFKCSCHGSGFYGDGTNFEEPAPRPLDRIKIALTSEGQLVVDKGIVYRMAPGIAPDEQYPQSLLKA